LCYVFKVRESSSGLESAASSSPTSSSTTSASTLAPAATSTALASFKPLASLLLFSKELFFALFLLSAEFILGLDATGLWLLQVGSIGPLGVCAVLARDDVVSIGRAGATIRTEAGKVETTDGGMFDVSQTAVGAEWTKATGKVGAWSNAQGRCGRNVKVGAWSLVSKGGSKQRADFV
jgi:hypothetical protein